MNIQRRELLTHTTAIAAIALTPRFVAASPRTEGGFAVAVVQSHDDTLPVLLRNVDALQRARPRDLICLAQPVPDMSAISDKAYELGVPICANGSLVGHRLPVITMSSARDGDMVMGLAGYTIFAASAGATIGPQIGSAIIAPDGAIVAAAGRGWTQVVAATLQI